MIFENEEEIVRNLVVADFSVEMTIIKDALNSIQNILSLQTNAKLGSKEDVLLLLVSSNLKSFSIIGRLIQTGYLSDAYTLLKKTIESIKCQIYFEYSPEKEANDFLNGDLKVFDTLKDKKIREKLEQFIFQTRIIYYENDKFLQEFIWELYRECCKHSHYLPIEISESTKVQVLRMDLFDSNNIEVSRVGPNYDTILFSNLIKDTIIAISLQLDILRYRQFNIDKSLTAKIKDFFIKRKLEVQAATNCFI